MGNINLDFGSGVPVTTKNTRTGGFTKSQAYNGMRYSVNAKGEREFTMSNAMWEAMQLATRGGMGYEVPAEANDGASAALLLTTSSDSDDRAVIFRTSKSKKGKKSKKVRSDKLETLLVKVGLLPDPESIEVTDKPVHFCFNLTKIENLPNTPDNFVETYEIAPDAEGTEKSNSSEAAAKAEESEFAEEEGKQEAESPQGDGGFDEAQADSSSEQEQAPEAEAAPAEEATDSEWS